MVKLEVAVAGDPLLAGADVIVTIGAFSYPYPASAMYTFVISSPSVAIVAIDCLFATGVPIVTIGGLASSYPNPLPNIVMLVTEPLSKFAIAVASCVGLPPPPI